MFKKFIFRRRFKKLLKRTKSLKRKRSFVPLQEVTTCLLFRTYNTPAEHLITKLKNEFPGLKFEQLWLILEGDEVRAGAFDILVSWRDLARRGRFAKPEIEKALDKEYDWLIDLTEESSPLAAALLDRSMAKCKVAWREMKGYKPDVTMAGIESREEFAERLPEYLKLLDR